MPQPTGDEVCERASLEKPRRAGDPPRRVASAAKAMRELEWKPRYSKLEPIVSGAWRWHQAHPNGYPD